MNACSLMAAAKLSASSAITSPGVVVYASLPRTQATSTKRLTPINFTIFLFSLQPARITFFKLWLRACCLPRKYSVHTNTGARARTHTREEGSTLQPRDIHVKGESAPACLFVFPRGVLVLRAVQCNTIYCTSNYDMTFGWNENLTRGPAHFGCPSATPRRHLTFQRHFPDLTPFPG